MEHHHAGGHRPLKFRLTVLRVDLVLAVIGLVRTRCVDRAACLCTNEPKDCCARLCALVAYGVLERDHALIVDVLTSVDDELELRARCPTHPLRELDQKLLDRRIRACIAHDVEIVRLDGVKIALILEPRDRRTVCAALQLLARLRLEIPRTRPCHIVVIRNICPCLDVLLLVHLRGRAVHSHIGRHVKRACVVDIR